MNAPGCLEFRAALERHLRGQLLRARALPEELAPLALDGHLATCPECRELLEAEEALEVLLASLPVPVLPPELAARVLARLDGLLAVDAGCRDVQQEARLDALLDREPAPRVPTGLAGRVLAGLSEARQDVPAGARLDSLLESLPAPEIPVGLAEHTLGALSGERAIPRRARLARVRDRRVLAAAAVLLATLSGVALWRALRPPPDGAPGGSPLVLEEEVPEELLANLELFADDWELLMADDLDAFLGTLPEEERLWLSAADASEAPEEPSDTQTNPEEG